MKKFIFSTIMIVFFLYLIFLLPVSFHNEVNKIDGIRGGREGDYLAVVYRPKPEGFLSIYNAVIYDHFPVYIVLYDKNKKYIGQTSPFHFLNRYDLNPILFVFPGDEFDGESDNFNLLIDGYGDAFKINIHHKTWWSWWFSLFY
ncbi:DUF6201 family protein [Dickeya dianthicola]|uniref:DUF6201 family protein n=1 Tax=Dickeya dianthicola TaxID=204039 RepID=UPI0008FBF6AD|nr:DUF6201 family protein [Dickeya dianthicola]MCI4029379.1 DUF6201 family protein [Dickeya dianthicola]MCI4071196.1 DUF6201 family protein [Dickeya dianthicola]MCI4175462.1 DUF6201 family protein [Dickeya dianthicola]MCI4178672.1 DUF6201 family protein [Dickeya dianthicola]MCI4182917.1 DUF6201 family protein [Dickeya dianthicola]